MNMRIKETREPYPISTSPDSALRAMGGVAYFASIGQLPNGTEGFDGYCDLDNAGLVVLTIGDQDIAGNTVSKVAFVDKETGREEYGIYGD